MGTTTERGVLGGLCYTPGCPHGARWIPVSHGRRPAEDRHYYCPDCCDVIAATATMQQRDIVGTFVKAGGQPVGLVIAVAEDGAVTIRPRFGQDYTITADQFERRYGAK